MKLQSDFSDLFDIEAAKAHPAYSAFVEEMEDRCYGREALNDAWCWFKAGWSRAKGENPE